jgi:hypothetical protein
MFKLGSTFRGLTEIRVAAEELTMLHAYGETALKVTAAGRFAIVAGISAMVETVRSATTADASGTKESLKRGENLVEKLRAVSTAWCSVMAERIGKRLPKKVTTCRRQVSVSLSWTVAKGRKRARGT